MIHITPASGRRTINQGDFMSNGNDIPINKQHLIMMNAGRGFHHHEEVKGGNEQGLFTCLMAKLKLKATERRSAKEIRFILKNENEGLALTTETEAVLVYFELDIKAPFSRSV